MYVRPWPKIAANTNNSLPLVITVLQYCSVAFMLDPTAVWFIFMHTAYFAPSYVRISLSRGLQVVLSYRTMPILFSYFTVGCITFHYCRRRVAANVSWHLFGMLSDVLLNGNIIQKYTWLKKVFEVFVQMQENKQKLLWRTVTAGLERGVITGPRLTSALK